MSATQATPSLDQIMTLADGLFGILSRAPLARKSTAVVLLNAGFLPRCGAFRLHAHIGRHLAALGYPVLRYDQSGVGDSLPYAERPPTAMLGSVLDVLSAQTGCTRFVVGGICSAADLGWQMAVADARIAGVISIDGMARRTTAYRLARLRRGLRKPPSEWLATLQRHLRPRSNDAQEPENLREWPAPGSERAQLDALLARGTELYALFTGGASHFLDRRQFGETFGRGASSEQVYFQHWPQCDHVFYDLPSRSRLIADLGEWLQRRLPD